MIDVKACARCCALGLALLVAAGSARAALIVSGPSSGVPGGTITLDIRLDGPFAASIDELELRVEFDGSVLEGVDTGRPPGSALESASVVANAGSGLAGASFVDQLAAIGPGALLTWTFHIAEGASVPSTTLVRARIDTFEIDAVPTGSLQSDFKSIAIVPEPATWLMVLAGLGAAVIGAGRRGAGSAQAASFAASASGISTPSRAAFPASA